MLSPDVHFQRSLAGAGVLAVGALEGFGRAVHTGCVPLKSARKEASVIAMLAADSQDSRMLIVDVLAQDCMC